MRDQTPNIVYLKLTFLLLFSSATIFGQINFEPGYIINNANNRKEGFIKNMDWVNSPSEILFKLRLDDKEIVTYKIENLKEFGIGDFVKYKKFNVQLDMSANSLAKMSYQKEPEFEIKTLLLKQLVGGAANLFIYEGLGLTRFFYNLENSMEIVPLIFKKYMINNNQVGENSEFRSHLFYNFKCEGIDADDSRKLKYDKKNLTEFFQKYNNCMGYNVVIYNKNAAKDVFKLKAKVGIASFNAETDFKGSFFSPDIYSATLSTEYNLRIGVELEYILPFNKNKWSVYIDPAYQSYKGSGSNNRIFGQVIEREFVNEIEANYRFIDVPIGVRHYMFLNENSKLFVGVAYAFGFNFGGEVTFSESNDLEINSTANANFGLGYEFKNKYSFEFRYATNRNITNFGSDISTNYSGVCVIFGYLIL